MINCHESYIDPTDNQIVLEDKKNSHPLEDSHPIMKPVFSAISVQSTEHEYEAPLSHTSNENMLEMIEKNPIKIEQYRGQTQVHLSDQLEHIGVDSY